MLRIPKGGMQTSYLYGNAAYEFNNAATSEKAYSLNCAEDWSTRMCDSLMPTLYSYNDTGSNLSASDGKSF